jgi:hypothetical protein
MDVDHAGVEIHDPDLRDPGRGVAAT